MSRKAASALLAAMAVAMFAAASAARAQVFDTYGQALEKAAPSLAAALRQRGLGEGAKIGIARFRARTADVTCEPLSSLLAEGLRKSFLTFNDTFRLGFEVAASVDPRTVPVLGGGRWHRGPNGEVVLSLVVGDAGSATLSTLAMTDVAFKAESLPRDARSCLLDFADVEREIALGEPAKVREAPSSLGHEITTLRKGAKVWVAAKVTTPGVGDWYVVDLDVDRDLPVGMRRQRGFVHGLAASGGGAADPAAANAVRDRVVSALRRYHAETSGLPLPFVFADATARAQGGGIELTFSGAALESPDEPRVDLGAVKARITPIDGGRHDVVVDLPAVASLVSRAADATFGRCVLTAGTRKWAGVWNDALDGFESLSIAIEGLRSACDGATVYAVGRLAFDTRTDDAGNGRRNETAALELSGFEAPRVAGAEGDSVTFRSLAVRMSKKGIDAAGRRTHLLSLGGDYFPIHLPYVAMPIDAMMLPDASGGIGMIDGMAVEIEVAGLNGSLEGGAVRFDNAGWRGRVETRLTPDGRLTAAIDSAEKGRINVGDMSDILETVVRGSIATPMLNPIEAMVNPGAFFRATDVTISQISLAFERGAIALSGTMQGDRNAVRDDTLPWRGHLDVDIRDAIHLVRALAHDRIESGLVRAETIDAFIHETATMIGLRPDGDDYSGRVAITIRTDGQPLINDTIGLEDYLDGLNDNPGTPETDGRPGYIVAGGPVNLREMRTTDSRVVARLTPGTRVAVFDSDAEWAQVVVDTEGFDTETGFVSSRFIADSPPPPRTDGVIPARGPFRAGMRFRDCADCPEMVVVPAGTFRMGDGGATGQLAARPVHPVTIGRPFAIGRTEVTRREWDACVADGGCDGRSLGARAPNDGNLPASNFSWRNAESFVAWLSRKTGMGYRLPSEAEWEYAARAGAATRLPWGDAPDPARGRFGLDFDSGPAPVGSYPANRFGLHDMIGNVAEFTADCHHASYDAAPADGRVWTTRGDCNNRSIRGGNWSTSDPAVASREWLPVRNPALIAGVRVARDL